MTKRSLLNSLTVVLILCALTACALRKTGDGLISGGWSCTPSGAAQAKAYAYSVTVYPYAVNCAGCHGAGTVPQFRVSNPTEAWLNLAQYYADENPLGGIRTKIGPPENHQVGLLPRGLSGFDSEVSKFNSMVDQYNAFCANGQPGGNDDGGGGGNTDGNNPTLEANRRFLAPLNLGNLNGTLASRTFTMATGTAAPFNTIQIQADFRVYDAGGTPIILMKNLRVSSPTKAVRVQNVRFKIGDQWKWSDYTNFAGVNAQVPQGTNFVTISSDSQILAGLRPNFIDPSNTLTISAQMEETTIQQTELQLFVAEVRPILINQCAGCHTNVGSYRFNATTTDQALRDLTVLKISRNTPATSLLFQKAQLSTANGGLLHQGSNTNKPLQNDNTSVNRILNWISKIQ